MAQSIISGYNGNVTDNVLDESLSIILSELKNMNEYTLGGSNELNFIKSILRTIEGVQGHREVFKVSKLYGTDDGSFSFDPDGHEEMLGSWSFARRGFVLKGLKFTYSLLSELEELKVSPLKFVKEKMKEMREFYIENYIPNVLYETLFKYPEYTFGESKRSYYGNPFGFLRGENVREDELKPYAKGDLERNHYRTIRSRHGIITKLDLFSISEYLSQYVDIKSENIVLQANRKQFNKIMYSLDIPYNSLEDNTYIEIDKNLKIAVNNFMPNDWVLATDKDAKDIITKLYSPNEAYRGVAMVKEKGFIKLEDVFDLIDCEFKVMPEGYHLTGRRQGCFLYTGSHKLTNDDGEQTRPLRNDSESVEVMNTMKDHVEILKKAWYKGLR